MNVASVDAAPVSLNVPVLAAGPLIALPSLAPPIELGAFLALFTGFVGKDESIRPSVSAERQPANQPDHEKDKSATKDPVTIAVAIAPAPAPNVLDLPQVLVEPAVSRNLPPHGLAYTQEPAPCAGNPSPAAPIASPSQVEPPIAFALQLTPAATPPVPVAPPNASASVETKPRSEVAVEPPPNPSVPSEPTPPVQHDTRAAASSSPVSGENLTANRPESTGVTNDPQDTRVAGQQPTGEFVPIAGSPQLVSRPPRAEQAAQPVLPLVMASIPDSPMTNREVKLADPARTIVAPLPADQHQSPGPQFSVARSATIEAQRAEDARPAQQAQPVQQPQPEQSSARSSSNPRPERVVLPRVQQQSTQQQAGNGQPGSRDSKAQAGDRRDESPDRNQSRIQKNPFAFEPHAQTAGETKTTAIGSSRPAVESREATIVAPEIETKATIQPQPARQISLKLAGPDSKQVDVQLMERAGRVQVSVRTADRQLAKSLQGDLGDLVGRLENKGFKTEAWVPASRHALAAVFEPGNTANGQGQPEHSGSRSGQQQQEHQGRNGSNQRQQPRWAAQLEETLSVEETGKENE